jgi:hypothetical protein
LDVLDDQAEPAAVRHLGAHCRVEKQALGQQHRLDDPLKATFSGSTSSHGSRGWMC